MKSLHSEALKKRGKETSYKENPHFPKKSKKVSRGTSGKNKNLPSFSGNPAEEEMEDMGKA